MPSPSRMKPLPGENDYAVQQGGSGFSHPGYIKCRKLIRAVGAKFLAAETAYDRNRIVSRLVLRWRSQTPPGGFLKQNDVSKDWHDVGDEEASKMIHRALMVVVRKSRRQGGASPEGLCGSAAEGHNSSSGRPSSGKASVPLHPGSSNPPSGLDWEKDLFWPLLGIKMPGEHDLTHQQNDLSQSGNRRFCALLEANRKRFQLAKTPDSRGQIASHVVNSWRSQNPPGRFLKLDTKTNLWYDVGDNMSGLIAQLLSMRDEASEDGNSSGRGEPTLSPRGSDSPSAGGHSQNDSLSGSRPADSLVDLWNESSFAQTLNDSRENSQRAYSASFVGLQNESIDRPADAKEFSVLLGDHPLLPKCAAGVRKGGQNRNDGLAKISDVAPIVCSQNESNVVASNTYSKMPMVSDCYQAATATHLPAAAATHPNNPPSSSLCGSTIASAQVFVNSGAGIYGAVGELTSNLIIILAKYPQLQQEDAMGEIKDIILPGLSFLSQSMMSFGREQRQQLPSDQQQQGDQQHQPADSHSSIDDAIIGRLGNKRL